MAHAILNRTNPVASGVLGLRTDFDAGDPRRRTSRLAACLFAAGLIAGVAFPEAAVLAADALHSPVVASERDDLSFRLPIDAGTPQSFDERGIAALSPYIRPKVAGGTITADTTVNSTADPYLFGSPIPGTLRYAIDYVNRNCPTAPPGLTITFAITTAPPHVISLNPSVTMGPLPTIICSGTLVDGLSQSGIVLDGSSLSPTSGVSGLTINANDVEVNGLAICKMPNHGIETFCGGSNSYFHDNFLGTDALGTPGLGNGGYGISVGDAECGGTIGTRIEANTVSYNGSGGILLYGGLSGGSSNEVHGNLVTGNLGPGLRVDNETGTLIGSLSDENLLNAFIGNAGAGVEVFGGAGTQFGINYTAGNSAGLGFDISLDPLIADGPTANDPGDSAPPQNYPDLSTITFDTSTGLMRVQGNLDTANAGPFTVLLFGGIANYEAGKYLGQFSVTAGGTFDQPLAINQAPMFYSGITANATSAVSGSESSEISRAFVSPLVTQNATVLDFGGVAVGASLSKTVLVSNAAAPAIAISLVKAAAPAFAISSATVAPTGYDPVNVSSCAPAPNPPSTCSIVVTFRPLAAGTSAGAVDFISNSPGLQRISVLGTGLAPPTVSMSFSPTTIPVSTSSTMTITLTNPNLSVAVTGVSFTHIYTTSGLLNAATPGGATTCTSGSETVTATGGTSSVALSGGTIPAGGSCTVTVNVTSATVGSYPDSLSGSTITTANVGAGVGSGTATLIVLAQPTVSMSFSPASVPVSTNSLLTITLTNPNASIAVTGVAFSSTYTTGLVNAASGATTCGGALAAAGGGNSVSLSGGTIPAGPGSCTVTVNVTSATPGSYANSISGITTSNAGTSTASAMATVTFTSPLISVTPSSLTFVSQIVGTTSAAQVLTIANTGTGDLIFGTTPFTVTAGFAKTPACPTILAPSASCTVSVTFTPTVAGAVSGQLTISSNASASPVVVALTGTGSPVPVPIVSLTPPSLSFGPQTVATSSPPQMVTLTNTGAAILQITNVQVVGAGFSFANACRASLAPGAACAITVTFVPDRAGSFTASLQVTTNAVPSPGVVSLSGTAVSVPVGLPVGLLSSSTSGLAFGEQIILTRSSPQSFSVTNLGDASVSISAISVTGDFAIEGECPVIPAGGSCAFQVTFAPTALGALEGQVVINSNASNAVLGIALSGQGVPVPGPEVALSPGTLVFGSNLLGNSSSRAVTLRNSGLADLAIGSIEASGDFTQSNGCPANLSSGHECQINVVFVPSVPGQRDGVLTITTNAENSPHSVTLSGVGCRFAMIGRSLGLSCSP